MEKNPKERPVALPNVNIISELKNAVYGILYSIVLIIFIRLFRLGVLMILLIICASSLIRMIYAAALKKQSFNFIALLKGWLWIFAIVGLFYITGKILGPWGYVLSMGIMAALILIPRRKQYMFLIRYIETIMYGKPINEFKKGEFKDRHKIKIEGVENNGLGKTI